jgi:hypothetical protein
MLLDIQVDCGMVLGQEPESQGVNILSAAGQKEPSRFCPVHFGVLLECGRIVLLRLETDRIHEDIAADAVLECNLSFRQAGCCDRTASFAPGIHKVDHHVLVFDQVIIKPDFLVLMGTENSVGIVFRPQRA